MSNTHHDTKKGVGIVFLVFAQIRSLELVGSQDAGLNNEPQRHREHTEKEGKKDFKTWFT